MKVFSPHSRRPRCFTQVFSRPRRRAGQSGFSQSRYSPDTVTAPLQAEHFFGACSSFGPWTTTFSTYGITSFRRDTST